MKKYGKFNEKGNEYIITDYRTPRPQMNYVWNERMLSGINHFGGGVGSYGNRTAGYIDEKGRGHANLIKDGNRYFYIRDMKTGAYWNPGWYPSKTDIEEYSCTHGIGYTKISAKKDGGFEHELLSVQKMKAELQNRVMIKTPVEKINALTNYWVKNQVQLCAEAGRATGKGFRDQLQDAWGIAAFDSGMARVKILEVLAHQYSDGRCVRSRLPLDPHYRKQRRIML